MMLEQGLYEYAAAQTDIAAIIGQPDKLRLEKLVVPQHSRFPCSVMQRTGTTRDQIACGTSRLLQATVQIDHYAKTWKGAAELAEAFRLALTDFAGMMGDVEVRNVTLQNEFDLDDPEPGLYRRSQSWLFWFTE